MNTQQKYLIGGKRMVELGSDRSTDDIDYLIYDENEGLFIHDGNIDYINAAAHPFYGEIWEAAKESGITPKLMFEMKAFSLVQHLQNFNFDKVAKTEYDMKRLNIDYDCDQAPIAKKHMTINEYNEVIKTIVI